jgi:hypothetical protein
VQGPAYLTNHGVLTILTLGLLEGDLTNASDGSLDINDSSAWSGRHSIIITGRRKNFATGDIDVAGHQ